MNAKKLLSLICGIAVLSSNTAIVQASNEVISVSESVKTERTSTELFAISFDGGDGSEQNPYIISTQEQLAFISDLPDKCYKLANDIELSGEWIPIGAYGEAFSGTFDGDGYTISDLLVSDGAGFFAEVTGTVKNLRVIGKVTSSGEYAGGIAGQSSGVFENCSFYGVIEGIGTKYIGGLIGYNEGKSVTNCHTAGKVICKSNNSFCGGLVGYNKTGNITDCHSDADINGGSRTGGLIGYTYDEATIISGCYSVGDIYSSAYYVYAGGVLYQELGGLIGSGNGTVIKCWSSGDIKTGVNEYSYAGGLIGYFVGTIRNSYAISDIMIYENDVNEYNFYSAGGLVGRYHSSIIENCYSRGNVTAEDFAGGLNGYSNDYDMKVVNCYATGKVVSSGNAYGLTDHYGAITNSYYDSQTSGCTDTGYGSPKTTSGMKNQLIYEDWDFDTVWAIDESGVINDGYPYLQWAVDNSIRVTAINFKEALNILMQDDMLLIEPEIKGKNVDKAAIEWTSSDENVAFVSGGLIIPEKTGSAVITATYGDVSASCIVNITDVDPEISSNNIKKSSAAVSGTVDLSVRSLAKKDATFIFCLFDTNNQLIDISIQSKSLVKGENTVSSDELSAELIENSGYTLKVYTWEDIEFMTPVTAEVISENII